MSWNNVIPFWVLLVEMEEHQAKMQCAFKDELDSGWLYSVPSEVSTPPKVYSIVELEELEKRNRKISQENALKLLGVDW